MKLWIASSNILPILVGGFLFGWATAQCQSEQAAVGSCGPEITGCIDCIVDGFEDAGSAFNCDDAEAEICRIFNSCDSVCGACEEAFEALYACEYLNDPDIQALGCGALTPCGSSGGDPTSPPDLSSYGYDYAWDGITVGFLLDENWDGISNTGYFYEDVTSAEECAQLCSDDGSAGGFWWSDAGTYPYTFNSCLCENEIVCMEPCVTAAGVGFATQSPESTRQCLQSGCENAILDDDYCMALGFDLDACLAKTGRGPTDPPTQPPTSGSGTMQSKTSMLAASGLAVVAFLAFYV